DCYNNATPSGIEKAKQEEASEYEAYKAKVKAEKDAEIKKEKEEEQKRIKANAAKVSSSSSSSSSSTGSKGLKGTKYRTAYSKIKILKTFDSSNCNKVVSIKGKNSITIAQSLAYTGSYYVVGMISRSDNAKLFVYNKNGKLVTTHSANSLGHSNGLTYGKDGKIYAIHGSSDNKLYCVSGANIAVKGNIQKNCVTLKHSPSGLAYDSYSDKYYFSSKSYFRVYNSNWKYLYSIKYKRRILAQDIGAYGGRVLQVISGDGNYIDMYNNNNKKYLGSFKVSLGPELESVAADSEGHLMFLFHSASGPETLWITKKPVFD
ncbi:MAG: hypothetical protein ACI31R_00245, partial [Bacilli bacterium]